VVEKIGYILLAIVAAFWLGAVLTGFVIAWPYGIIGLIGISGVGLLLIKVISDRLKNKEDDYYSDNVDK
jgi:membrane protein implicated in regulation of membrane protease activity